MKNRLKIGPKVDALLTENGFIKVGAETKFLRCLRSVDQVVIFHSSNGRNLIVEVFVSDGNSPAVGGRLSGHSICSGLGIPGAGVWSLSDSKKPRTDISVATALRSIALPWFSVLRTKRNIQAAKRTFPNAPVYSINRTLSKINRKSY